jgi:hypothetical protein
VVDQWTLLDYCFTRYLNLDLTDALHTRSWGWFVRKVSGLLSDDTLIARHFHHQQKGSEAWLTGTQPP